MIKRTLVNLVCGGAGGGGPLADVGLALLRVVVGLFLVVGHGWPKLTDPSPFIDNAVRGTFPAPEVSGWFAILGEFLGGLLLALGLGTRVAALWVAGVFVGAAFLTHGPSFTGDAPFFLPAKGSVEPALLYLVIGLTFALTGGGRFSLDAAIRGKKSA